MIMFIHHSERIELEQIYSVISHELTYCIDLWQYLLKHIGERIHRNLAENK